MEQQFIAKIFLKYTGEKENTTEMTPTDDIETRRSDRYAKEELEMTNADLLGRHEVLDAQNLVLHLQTPSFCYKISLGS